MEARLAVEEQESAEVIELHAGGGERLDVDREAYELALAAAPAGTAEAAVVALPVGPIELRFPRLDAAARRFLDIVVSAIALVVLAPVLAVIALALKLDSPGPVLFRQRRVGQD